MRAARRKEEVVIDQNYLQNMYQKILKQIKVLNDLNQQYKLQQEEHFIDIFMKVLEKMGNDLILAHEAYRNIDIEVKRDNYCVDLAKQVTFFKSECAILTDSIKRMGQEQMKIKMDKENLETQMRSLKNTLTKKMEQNCLLKEKNQKLQKQLQALHRQVKITKEIRGAFLQQTNLEQYMRKGIQQRTMQTENEKTFTNRFLRSNQRSQRAGVSVREQHAQDSPRTPQTGREGRYAKPNRNSSSFRRRSCQRNASTIEVFGS